MTYPTRGARGIGAHSTNQKLAKALGWFSIGLGLAELFATRAVTRAIGLEGREVLVRSAGVREVMTGTALLMSHDPEPWMWWRVGGDALDLATMATGLEGENPKKATLGLAVAAVAGVTALDVAVAQGLAREQSLSHDVPTDYYDRSGLPKGVQASRGLARDLQVPDDFRIPEPLRPYGDGSARTAM